MHVLHPFSDWPHYRRRYSGGEPELENDLLTYRSESVNPYPRLPRLAFRHYQHRLLARLDTALEQQGRPEAVLVHSALWAGAALAEPLQRRQLKWAVSEHLKEFIAAPGFTGFQKQCIRKAYAVTSRIIATSQALKTGIETAFPAAASKLTLIPNPVDTTLFTLKPARLRRQAVARLTAVALFRPEKGLELLVQAFAELPPAPGLHLRLIGGGPGKTGLERLIRRLKLTTRVSLVEHLAPAELVRELHQTDVLILPSSVETFGMVLIEALACGVPVLATRCGGPEDIVTPQNGILVAKDSLPALTDGLRRMIAQYARFDPETIRSGIVAGYGQEAYVRRINRLLDAL